MKYGKITITESGEIKADFVNGEIWMSVSEIINLFGVFYQTLDKNIKSLLYEKILDYVWRIGLRMYLALLLILSMRSLPSQQ